MTLHLQVVSPEKIVFEDEVAQVTVPTVTGEITILPGHVPLVSQLDHGEIVIHTGNKQISIAVAGGFLEVSKNTVSILADYAIQSTEINEQKAGEAKERAEKLMKEKTSERDFLEAQAIFRRAILELKIANKRKHYSGKPTNI